MKKHLKIKFSSFDTFCLILKIKQMAPLGFGKLQLIKVLIFVLKGLYVNHGSVKTLVRWFSH